MTATVIIGGMIFGYASRVVYKMWKKDSCSDCHCACPVGDKPQKPS
nr:FeoB-associated Cys-rich membrane protein [Enterococcus sp. 8G7_MSG3316]